MILSKFWKTFPPNANIIPLCSILPGLIGPKNLYKAAFSSLSGSESNNPSSSLVSSSPKNTEYLPNNVTIINGIKYYSGKKYGIVHKP